MKAPYQKNTVKTTPLQSSSQHQHGRADRQSDSFVDNRKQAQKQTAIQQMADASPRGDEIAQLQVMAEVERPNRTGLPDNLKAGIENLSGYSMDDVKVHYNSGKPATLQAHAYAQGTDIHLAPGQEKHLPHEAWHVVQQKQGRVQPTLQMKGRVDVNVDSGLEKEADVMGHKATQSSIADEALANNQPPLQRSVLNTLNIAQRKVMVDGKPATMIDKATAYVNGTHVGLSSDKAEWVTDGYNRVYLNNKEFKDHQQGSPVDVGLAKKLGKWYRLPFFSRREFFVLGENHGAFGYRELIRESNQPGKVLGEGGSNTLMSAEPDSPLEFNKGLKDELQQPREHTMENVAAKTYFGLTFLKEQYKKEAEGAGAARPSNIVKLPEKQWLANYQAADPADRRVGTGLNAVPYYLNSSGEKVYATFGTKAENYNTSNTAKGILNTFESEINAYSGPVFEKLTNAKEALQRFLTIQREDQYNFPRLLSALNMLLDCMLSLSFAEAEKLTGGNPNSDLKARFEVTKKNQPKWDVHRKKAMAHRDYVMYLSVLKAKDDHIMAGMGDHHATNLKDDLERLGIPVILFNDFLTAFSTDAIAPLTEEPDYDKKVKRAELHRDQYVQLLMKIIRDNPSEIQSQALVPSGNVYSNPTMFESFILTDQLKRMLNQLSLSANFVEQGVVDPDVLARLMKSIHIAQTARQPDQSLSLTSSGADDAPQAPKVRNATPAFLTEIRNALKGVFVYPSSEGESETRLVTKERFEQGGWSMTAIFDQFIFLLNAAGDVNITFSGTLNDCLGVLSDAFNDDLSRNLISIRDSAIRQKLFMQLALIFNVTGLGSTRLSALLAYADGIPLEGSNS